MPAPLDLSPEEQSFFDAGDAIDEDPGASGQRRRHSRRHRRSLSRRLRNFRGGSWLRVTKSALLTIAAVWVGYRVSMMVVDRTLPDQGGLEALGP